MNAPLAAQFSISIGLLRASVRCAIFALALPAALAAQQRATDPDDLQPANGRIIDSLGGISSVRELHDGRVLIADTRGQIVVADFSTGRARPLSGIESSRYVRHLIALPGDSSLLQSKEAWIYLDGTRVAGRVPLNTPAGTLAPTYYGADANGFLLTIVGDRPEDSVRVVRTSRTTGANEEITRVWLREPLDPPFADTREQAVLAPDGWIAVFRVNPYRVDWRSPAGAWTFGAPLALPMLAMDRREKETYMAPRASFVPPGHNTPEAYPVWPATVELFSGGNILRPTLDGQLLILRRPIADARGSLYDVVDRRGKLVREFELETTEQVVGFGEHSIYVRVAPPSRGASHLERHPWP